MKYLSTAFCGEGPTDYSFLAPLAQRLAETILAERADEVVEVGAIVSVLDRGRATNQTGLVLEQFQTQNVFADLLFVHSDAGGSSLRAHETRVDPLRVALADLETAVVGVVPDRETEAWMLCDIRALERVLGLQENSLPSVSAKSSKIHTITDPKKELNELLMVLESRSGRKAKQRRGDRLRRVHVGLAVECDLDRLRETPSFQQFEADLTAALEDLGLI